MQLSEAVRKRIINLANERNITLHRLSLESGISYSTLSSFINGKSQSPKLVTLLHICEGFEIELNEFFTDKLFKDVEED
ncbi:MAG: helix-turn-helix transcriptional regulator [Clostridia bacterium]|nr:helix-turn-helix transcriptional regulator [Clostridia bacterium]